MPQESELVLTIEGERELMRKIDRLPAEFRNEVGERALTESALLLEQHVKRDELSGQVLHVRTGRLRASVTHRVEQEGDDLVARVGPHVVYERIHEFGGTISARNVQNLTIPINEALTPAGVARYSARDLINDPSLGGFKRTFFRNHKLFGVLPSGKVRPVFVLKPSVAIPERPYLRPALAQKAREIIQIVTDAVQRALDSA